MARRAAAGKMPIFMPPTIKAGGFTLSEMLVVLAILALMTSAAIWTLRPGSNGARVAAEGLAARADAARNLAIVDGGAVAITINAEGYFFERARENGWQRVDERRLRARHWASGITPDSSARLIFDRFGLATPATLVALRQTGGGSARVRIEADGQVQVE